MSAPAVALTVLAGLTAVLLGGSIATAIPSGGAYPDRAEYLRGWSALHGGYDPAGRMFTGRWLALLHRLARPLASWGVRPSALTGWGVLISAAVPVTAWFGRRWVLLAFLLLLASGVPDGLDGAVAVLTGRVSRWGSVLDSAADRLSDSAYVTALFAVGAPGWLCVAGGAAAALQEYARARAGAAGLTAIAVVTVWERPSRILLTAAVLLGCGLLVGSAGTVATIGGWLWLGMGALGLTQLLLVVRRRLR